MDRSAPPRTLVLGVLGAATALLLTGPGPASSWRVLAATGSAPDPTAPLIALLTLLAWCCSAYLLSVGLATAGSRLPGAAGAVLGELARRSAPAGLRRALEVALGVTLAVGTLGGGTALAVGPVPPAGAVALADPVPSLERPNGAPAARPSADGARAGRPPASSVGNGLDWPGTPAPGPVAAGPGRPSGAPAGSTDRVIVRPGDSLWSIAGRRLGPGAGDRQVAEAWPAWWQANRRAVGEDPDVLRPGTPLVPPAPRPATAPGGPGS